MSISRFGFISILLFPILLNVNTAIAFSQIITITPESVFVGSVEIDDSCSCGVTSGFVDSLEASPGSNMSMDVTLLVEKPMATVCDAHFYGNSILVGFGTGSCRWAEQVTGSLEYNMVSHAIGGTTMQDTPSSITGVPRANNFLSLTLATPTNACDILILAYGINDLRIDVGGNYNLTEFISDYTVGLKELLAIGWTADQIMMLDIYYVDPSMSYQATVNSGLSNQAATVAEHLAYNSALQVLADSFNIELIKTYDYFVNNGSNSDFIDGTHPKCSGHDILRDKIGAEIFCACK